MHATAVTSATALFLLASMPLAQAADATYTSSASFAGAAGALTAETFEGLGGRGLTLAPVFTPGFAISSASTPLGVQTDSNTPGDGFGAFGTAGPAYVLVYRSNQAPGTIVLSFNTPVTAAGLDFTDLGEVPGVLNFRTDTGAYAAGTDIVSWPVPVGNGGLHFAGITQNQPFTQLFITATGVDEAYGLDNVRVSAVPEPAPLLLLLLLAGLAGLAVMGGGAGAQRRRRPA